MTIAVNPATQPKVSRRRRKLSLQYSAYFIHSLMGLKLTLLLTVVLLSGALATVQQEIDWLLYDEMRAQVQQERLGAGELLDKLQAAYPDNGMFFFRTAEDYPHLNAYARYIDNQGGWRQAWIDPYSGEVTGDTVLLTVGQFIGFLHATLFLPAIGNSVVNALGLLVLISLITGLIAVPKFWRYFLVWPRRGNLRVFLGDLHRLVGLWSLWVVLIIGVTGSWWFYQDPFVKYFGVPDVVAAHREAPVLEPHQLSELAVTGVPVALTAAQVVERVTAAYPDLQINVINPPEYNAELYEVIGKRDEWLLSEWKGDRVFVHPYTGEIIATYATAEFSPVQRFDLAMQPLHYGTWANKSTDITVKVIYLIGGLAMSFLAISGLIVSYKRVRRAAKKAQRYSLLRKRLLAFWKVVRPWGGPMGVFKYFNLFALIGICYGTSVALTLSEQGTRGSGYLYAEQSVGPWQVSMNAVAGLLEKDLPPIRPGVSTVLNASLSSEALQQIQFIYANVGEPLALEEVEEFIHGPIGAKHMELEVPEQIDEETLLWVTAVDWQGQVYRRAWPLLPNGELTYKAQQN